VILTLLLELHLPQAWSLVILTLLLEPHLSTQVKNLCSRVRLTVVPFQRPYHLLILACLICKTELSAESHHKITVRTNWNISHKMFSPMADLRSAHNKCWLQLVQWLLLLLFDFGNFTIEALENFLCNLKSCPYNFLPQMPASCHGHSLWSSKAEVSLELKIVAPSWTHRNWTLTIKSIHALPLRSKKCLY
jgi:hypothetical protein